VLLAYFDVASDSLSDPPVWNFDWFDFVVKNS
jgi:hypothetical protein